MNIMFEKKREMRKKQREFLLKKFLGGEHSGKKLMILMQEEFKDCQIIPPMGKACVYDWLQRFKRGNLAVEEAPKTGRPAQELDDRVGEEIAIDPYAQCADIAARLKLPWTRVKLYMQRKNLRGVCGMWVPKDLSQELRDMRLEYCRVMVVEYSDPAYWDNVIFEGERILYYNKDVGRNGKGRIQDKLRCDNAAQINMQLNVAVLRIWWTSSGYLRYRYLPLEKRLDQEDYKNDLMGLYADMTSQGLTLGGRSWILHRNESSTNPEAHCPDTLAALGWTSMLHPLQCPDISPTDYHVLLKFHNIFSTYNNFTKLEELDDFTRRSFARRKPDYYDAAVDILPEKWHRVIETEGDYIPTHEKVD